MARLGLVCVKYMSQLPFPESPQAPSSSGLDAISLTAALVSTGLALWAAWEYLTNPGLSPEGDSLCWASYGMYRSLESCVVDCFLTYSFFHRQFHS